MDYGLPSHDPPVVRKVLVFPTCSSVTHGYYGSPGVFLPSLQSEWDPDVRGSGPGCPSDSAPSGVRGPSETNRQLGGAMRSRRA